MLKSSNVQVIEGLINASSIENIYKLRIYVSRTEGVTEEQDNANNRESVHIKCTIQSTDSSYGGYNDNSINIIACRLDDGYGDFIFSVQPTTGFNCQNLAESTIYETDFTASRGAKGKRNLWFYWKFDGNYSGYYPNGAFSGSVTTGQTTRRINLDPNGGNVSPLTFEVNYGDTIGKIPTPIRDGFKFLGWEYNGQLINQNYLVQVNMKLTARWEEDSNIWVKDGTWKRAILWKKTNGKWERSKDGIN